MADILNRRTKLQVREAQEGDRLAPHTVHVAPPDYHGLVNGDGMLSPLTLGTGAFRQTLRRPAL
jgi:two-component system chemotaxis response regulator CheB